MKSKTPLLLMELLVMILVFAFVSAWCLQIFTRSEQISETTANRDRAVLEAQNMGEILRSCDGISPLAAKLSGGEQDGTSLTIRYDENWTKTTAETAYTVTADEVKTDSPFLGKARICVWDAEGTCLAALSVCWQKEVGET